MTSNQKNLQLKNGISLTIKLVVVDKILMVLVIQPIKFDTKVIKSNLCDYSDAYILVTGHINNKVVPIAGAVLRNIAFKNCAPFRSCGVNINDEFIEKAENIDIISPMYNLLEYSDSY